MSELDLAVLQALRLKGRASAEALADVVGADPGVALDGLAARGLVIVTPQGAWKLTPDGRVELESRLGAERAETDRDRTRRGYESFSAHNATFKEIVSSWQMKDDSTPNDHADVVYDGGVVARLGALHAAARPVVASLCEPVARLSSQFPRRLDEAWTKVESGDRTWIAKPLIDSYHTVWFELHEEHIGLAGLTRADEARAGRGA